jgi:uncharacterized protein
MLFIPEDMWEVRKTAEKGRGLFAKKDIDPGTIIGDYLGKVVSPKDEDDIDEEKNFYLMYYHDRASIFPELSKPGIYLLNHSCTPNTWMYTYRGHTLFFTIRKIFKGEELTINYLLSPLDNSCSPCTHLCSCHGVICHHTMHLPQKKYDLWSKFHDRQMAATKPERIRYGKELPPLSEYPDSLPDEPIYDLFGAMKEIPEILDDIQLPSRTKIRRAIRETGRTLLYPKLNLQIFGVTDDLVISKTTK